ncbi:DNA repair protein [Aeromonas caviae]|nr:DNA repair protein [Aeromonas caviae]
MRICHVVLDNQHRVLAFEELFHSTLSSASVYPREVVKRALALNAAALMLMHNHPSGHPEPSRADIEITHRLQSALELVDIRLLDHLVVATEGIVSLAERGCLG